MKKKTTRKRAAKTKQPPTPVCENQTIGETEFHVYYGTPDGGQWELDGSFNTFDEAETYCREQSADYAEPDEDAVPVPWMFYIYEVKAVRALRYHIKHEIIAEEL